MQIIRNLKHIFWITSITVLLIVGVMRFFQFELSNSITHFLVYREGNGVLDLLYKYKFIPSKDIVIIKIDENSLNFIQSQDAYRATKQNLRMLTIPKSEYIKLIENLQSAGVKGIAFDILFQNSDPNESEFAQVLEKYPNMVIGTTRSSSLRMMEPMNCHKDQSGPHETCEGIPRSLYKNIRWGEMAMEETRDRRIGSIDISGTPYAEWKNASSIDTLSLALYKVSSGTNIPVFPMNEVILHPFFGTGNVYSSNSFSSVISMSKVNLIANFSEKYVLIGESGTIIQDQHKSPASGKMMDGVEYHAHFLDGILQKRFLKGYDITDFSFGMGMVFLTLFMVTLYIHVPKFVSLFVSFFMIFYLIFIGRYLYFSYGIVLDMMVVLLAGSVLSFPVTFIYRFFVVDREKRMLKNAFSHYVDPEVVKQISDKAHTIKLGGESRELSILFSDIAGFTTISENTPVTDLFSLMSLYLSKMTGILIENGGTLDKYIGDAVMGFFGAPLSFSDHAKKACKTALDMRHALPEFNKDLINRGLEPIDFRVGIGTGEVLVGNIGSHNRFNYTVLGDTVNLASRLEATSKEYGTHIIVSEGTYLQVKDDFFFRRLDLITVKGKNNAVGIYELIADIRDTSIDREKYFQYEKALELYIAGKYLEAGQIWESQMKEDNPSHTMALRCVQILKGELIVEGGVYHMTKK